MGMCEEEESSCNKHPAAEPSPSTSEEANGCYRRPAWDDRRASTQTAANALQEHYRESPYSAT